MKTKSSFILKSSVALILAFLMLFGTMTTSIAAVVDEFADAGAEADVAETGGGRNWYGNVFFRAPDSWNLSTYPNVQVWAVQSTTASSGGKQYSFLLGNMSIVGSTSNSRLYHYYVNTNHSTWGDNEYLAFTANSSNWSTGGFYISTCGQYTAPYDYGVSNSSGSYLFTPSNASNNTASNNNTISGSYNGTNRDVLKKNQDFYVYTGGTSGAAGGKVDVTAYYVNGSNFSGSSAIASSTITVNSSDTNAHEQYGGAVEGTKVSMTATANDGYKFDGYYTAGTGGSSISSSASYDYYVYGTKSVYARFSLKTYTITYNKGANGSGTVASTTKTHGTAATLSSSTFTRSGYTQDGWSTSDGGAKAYDLGGSYTTNADITLYPHWSQNTYTVKKTETGGSGGTVKVGSTTITTSGVSIAHGTYTVTVTAPTGYNVTAVSIGGTAQSITAGSSVTINSVAINAAKTIAVTYAQKTYAITLSETGASGGTMQVDSAAFTSGSTVTHGSHTFRVDAPSGYVIDSISGIGTWTKSGDNSYATLGSTSITSAQTISVTYVASGRPSLDAISDVSKDANTTTFNVTASISDEDKKTGTLTATASSSDTTVATVGSPTVSGSTVTIPVTIKGKVDSSTISVTLKDGGTDLNTQTFSVSMTEPTFTIAAKTIDVSSSAVDGGTITDGGVTPSSVAYTSSNTEYITVGASNGKLTTVKVPTAQQTSTITATATYASGYTKTATYTATLNKPTLTASSSKASGNIGDTATGSLTSSNPSTSSIKSYSWTSSNNNVVAITNNTTSAPTFTFKKNGSATITLTVTYKNTLLTNTATTSITVSAPTVSFSSSTAASINVGGTVQRTATGSTLGSEANGSVSYSGTNSYINVAADGTVTGLKPTSSAQTVTATYTVTCGGQTSTATATYKVSVTAPTVSLSGNSTLAVGDTMTVSGSSSGATTTPTWTYAITSGGSYATINSSTGVVTGTAAGTVKVKGTANYGNGYTKDTSEKTITVETPAIVVKDGSSTVSQTSGTTDAIYTTVGTNKTLTIEPNFSDNLTAKSSKTSVATVSITGTGSSRTLTITPVAAGTCNVSLSTNSGYAPTGVDIAETAAAMPDGLVKEVFELAATGAVNETTVTIPVRVAAAESGHVVYFTDNKNWGGVDIHAWGADGTAAIADHAAMTKIGVNENNESVYAYRFTDSQWTNVQHIRFLKTNQEWGDNQNQTVTVTDFSQNAYYCSNDNSPRGVGLWTCTVQKPQITANDVTIDMGSTQTMTATVLTSGTPSTFNWSSGDTSVATTADTHTASNVITGVYPGTSTITVKAYAEKPSGWNSIVTDGTADDYVAGTTTATATVTADPKTVTFGGKITSDGSTYTDQSGLVTAKYYDEDTSGSGSSSGSSSSGGGAGYYVWYNLNNSKNLDTATCTSEMIDLGNGTCYTSFTCAAGQNYDIVINQSSSSASSILNSSTTVTGNQTWAKVENNGSTYWALDSYSASVPIYVIYNNSANSVTFTTTNPASGSSSGGSSSGGSSSGTGTTGSGTSFNSGASVPYGKVAVFTAEASYTSGGNTYKFTGWYDASGNKVGSDLEYSVKITEAKTVYARYYKVLKLSAFDSYTKNGDTVTFVTAPPKTITVKHGDDYYIYNYDGTAATGNPDSPDGDQVAALPIASGTYGQGNYIQFYVGDEITLYYNAMASSEIFKGVFYNNSANYYVAKPSSSQYVAHTYTSDKTLYMNRSYYDSVPSGLPTTTVDPDAHSIKFTGTQDYKNIDVETASKRKVYFSDYTNAVIGSKNTDDYYADGEALSVTGDQLTVAAAKSSTQTNVITGSSVGFYKANADGTKGDALTSAQISALGLSVSGTSTGTSSADGTALVINGTMPTYDLYIDLNMSSSYTIKLGNKIISDVLANKTRLADEVAAITITGGAATLTASSSADVTSSTSVGTGTALTLTTAFNSGWSQYYTFVGWYWGSDSAPDYENGFISDKLSLNYTPKKGGTIWAVGTRSLFINGSKYITGKDTDWYGENNTQKNLPMSFDAESGRYYWEISDTMFAAAGYNYKTWQEGGSATESYGKYFESSSNYYWEANEDKYHGKSFFQILDKESGSTDKTLWDNITSFKVDTPANGPTYGKIYPRDYNDDYYKKHDGQGFINFNESDYGGYSSPLRIYYNPSASGNAKLTVEATKIYSNIYVSNGFTVGSTLRTSNVTVQPVVDGVVKTSGQAGYFSVNKQGNGWDPDMEGHVDHYKPQKKGATVRITKTAGGSDKIVAFFIYDITNKTVRAEKNIQKNGSNYYIDLTLANEEQNLYIVPIVEEAGANVTITFDATQLNRKQWGDIVTAYAWYSGSGGNALGAYPGQPMIPSDDMTTWTTTFKGTNSGGDELQGITFSNYVDGNHSWLGCSINGDGVMGTVSDHKTGTASGGIVNVYNHVYSGTSGEYARTNFKAQTYDYREPIALYDRFKDVAGEGGQVSISFSMKDGNSNLISWQHQQFLDHNILTLEPHPNWDKLNWEYLTNAKGDKYIDMNGNTIKTKPTASFYVTAKGQVMYGNSNMNYVFYGGKDYDSVTGVNYGAASGVGMNYAVQWYVYDASGNYITNVLTAGIADLSSNNIDSYIGKRLEDMGYAVDGKSVAICYDKPRYMYGDAESGSGAVGYNDKRINVGNDFDAYRFTGQWNAVASSELVKVNVGVGMMTDSGEVLAPSNTAAYGNASASYDRTKGNNVSVTNEDGDTAPFTASDGSFVRTAVRDSKNSPVKLNASAQNFIGWYYYDANTGDFVKASYASNENFYPSYSTKDVTFYAMYRASAIYQYNYTGREGARTYSASGEDLTAAEMGNNNVINPASHVDDIKAKVPVGIGVFKKDIDFTPTNYGDWEKTPDSNGYILNISGFATSTPTYRMTAYYRNANGDLISVTQDAQYSAQVVNLTAGSYTASDDSTKPGGTDVTKYYNKTFLGWYEYDGETIGDLISTQHNYGLRLTRDQKVIAVYDDDGHTLPTDGWHVAIDENEVNKELTTSTTGVFYNDTIVRVRNSDNVTATLSSGAKIGVVVVTKGEGATKAPDSYRDEQLLKLVNPSSTSYVASGNTATTKSGLIITNMQATTQTSFNRTDIAVRSDFAKTNGLEYCVYAYFYDGSGYHFSGPSAVKTYE